TGFLGWRVRDQLASIKRHRLDRDFILHYDRRMFSAAIRRSLRWHLVVLAAVSVGISCNRQPEPDASTADGELPIQEPSLLLVTVDTLRPDRLEPYGASDVETPTLARLAEGGIVFDRAYAVAPITLPSHASILTGLYPPQHGVRNNGINFLEEDLETLAEMLQGEGFRTAAFVGAAVLGRRYGLGQGFESYDDRIGGEGGSTSRWGISDRPAVQVVRSAREWLDGMGPQERFFAWVHLFDPHAPYAPPSPFAERYATRPYDGEVAYIDAQIGWLLEHPRIDRDVLVTVVGDHGESLDEHGEGTHGILVYDSTLQIPWILKVPGGPKGRREESPVSQIDILPTLLGFLGVDSRSGVQGRSLEPRIVANGELSVEPLYAESYQGFSAYGWARLHTLLRWPWKLIQATTPELYNLEQDPGETTDLAGQEQTLLETLEAELDPFIQESEQQIALDDETAQALRSLGYMAATQPRALEDHQRPDPREMIGLHNELLEFFDRGPHTPSETITELERVLDLDPDNLTALRELPQALADAGRYEEIEAVIQRILALDANPASILLLYATIEHQHGNLDKALGLTEEALELDPGLATAWMERTSLLLQLGDVGRARTVLEEAVRQCPEEPWLDIYYARLAEMADGQTESAVNRLRQALDEDPTILEGHLFLSEALESSEEIQAAADTLSAALERWPENPELHSRLGLLSIRLHDSDAAELHLSRALSLTPEPRPDIQAALDFVRSQSAGQTPGPAPDSTPGVQQAATHLQAGRLDDAQAELDRLHSDQPRDTDVLALMAAVQIQRGNLTGAEDLLQQVLEIDPQQASTWSDLGLIVEQQGRIDEARKHYDKALQIDPGLWQALVNLGISAGRQQDWQRAADYLEEALRVAPGQRDLHLELADLYAGPLNRPDLAKDHLASFLSAAPGDPRADLVRQRLSQLADN
ncbi:MAG: tetratricopeptide repeat protein, partial [Thermoanaerobaculia bacterium]